MERVQIVYGIWFVLTIVGPSLAMAGIFMKFKGDKDVAMLFIGMGILFLCGFTVTSGANNGISIIDNLAYPNKEAMYELEDDVIIARKEHRDYQESLSGCRKKYSENPRQCEYWEFYAKRAEEYYMNLKNEYERLYVSKP